MSTVYFDPSFSEETRRQELYKGNIMALSARQVTRDFCEFAKGLIKEAFAPLDPETAQHHLPVEQYAEILGKLKPTFIHHPKSKEFVTALLAAYGCDPAKTYYEVPKLRSSTSDGYLTKGIAAIPLVR
jgi:hypothetical protein